jgi:hypothetical protein
MFHLAVKPGVAQDQARHSRTQATLAHGGRVLWLDIDDDAILWRQIV